MTHDTVYFSTVKKTPDDTWYCVLFYSKEYTTWHVILCTFLQ